MSQYLAKSAQFALDVFVLSLAFWAAFMFRFEFNPNFPLYKLIFFTWPYVVLFQYFLLVMFGVPKFSWRYISLKEMKTVILALGISSGVLMGLRLGLVDVGGYSKFVIIPLGVLAMNFILAFLGIAGIRVLRRILSEQKELGKKRKATDVIEKSTILIGAGRAGVTVAKEVASNPALGMKIIGFVDDDPLKIGTIIQGHKVLGNTASLPRIIKEHSTLQAIITIAAASGSSIRSIVNICEKIPVPVKIIPGIDEILGGKVNLSRIREVTIEDLLGRETVDLDKNAISSFLNGKIVLVTGAGGSIGSEACRQIGRFNPEKLILVEQAENSLFQIHQELSRTMPNLNTVPSIADVCDAARIDELFSKHKPQVVFHAAAHKHVPMMEWNPGEAIKNNIFGTKQVAITADKYNAEAFVMISTDKAVNPTSIMGTSKRVAELVVQGLSQQSKTKFVAVRFGNVLGSAGSVIPTFKDQIARGGPITITHPEMQRYFMTIPEACQLVMQAATMGKGSEIFVLDMGEPVFIIDLANDLIRLSGFAKEEINIEFSGLRPGEKLFEELSTAGENMTKTRHPKILIGKINSFPMTKVNEGLKNLKAVSDGSDRQKIREVLRTLVPEMIEPATNDNLSTQTKKQENKLN